MTEPQSQSSKTERLEFIDSLRGFALIGVYAANLLIFAGVAYMTDEQRTARFQSPVDSFVYSFERFFIENKFMGLFSLLFGISFWLFLTRVRLRASAPLSLFYKRIFWLFLIGLVHGWLLWSFDILRFYALWALLLPLFLNVKPRRLLIVALLACIVVPAILAGINAGISTPPGPTAVDYDALVLAAFANGSYSDVLIANWKYDWYLTLAIGQLAYQVAVFGRLLLGLYIARTMDFENLRLHRSLLWGVLISGALIGVIGSTIFTFHLLTRDPAIPLLALLRRLITESGQLGLSLAYASSLALAFLTMKGRVVVSWLAPIGKMALTWYLFQTLLGVWMFYGFTHGPFTMGQTSLGALAVICIIGFIVQAVLATLWLKRFQFGPMEWVWRSLTYSKIQRFRKR